jgi:hypothetical protein
MGDDRSVLLIERMGENDGLKQAFAEIKDEENGERIQG